MALIITTVVLGAAARGALLRSPLAVSAHASRPRVRHGISCQQDSTSSNVTLHPELLQTAREAVEAAEACTPTEPPLDPLTVGFNRLVIDTMKGAIDVLYDGRDIQRFYVLETIARVPYFSFLSCLHLYESLGAREHVHRMRMHYAEADNELHHLLIMEALGGADSLWGSISFPDRLLAQHLAFGYFWYCVAIYLLHPRAAYHLSELVEEHAFHTYNAFLKQHEDVLRAQPVPPIAHQYYSSGDALEAFMRAGDGERRPRKLHSLYDVFCEVRDDESAHWRSLVNLVQHDDLEGPEGCLVVSTAQLQQDQEHLEEHDGRMLIGDRSW